MREHGDAEIAHGDDIGRSSCCATSTSLTTGDCNELWVSAGDYDPSEERASDEKDTESQIDCFESGFDVRPGAFGFCCHHRNILWSHDSKGG